MKKLFLSIPKPVLPLCTTLLLIALILQSSRPEEGLFPLNYINIHALKNAGLKLEAKDIFNPNGLSLTNALVKVGGCTGSFISDDGLIITNHHCVYGGVAGASSLENNYLENGFVAKDKTQEIPIHLPCKITSSYEDVSIRVLVGIDPGSSPSERA
ncbi:MAG: S46 family peptidase, partial [Flavobacteriaceae bacterium]|nr:S46 family peptidase [Flavobacteriaceae bacterium]